jgi:hypothetical protein
MFLRSGVRGRRRRRLRPFRPLQPQPLHRRAPRRLSCLGRQRESAPATRATGTPANASWPSPATPTHAWANTRQSALLRDSRSAARAIPGTATTGRERASIADPCSPNPCTTLNRSVCVATGSVALCSCDPGFRDDGAGGCVLADPCSPNPCTAPNRSVCSAAGAVALCSCDDGNRDDGTGGCMEACDPNPCVAPHQHVCSPAPGGFQCSCDPGYVAGTAGCQFEAPASCAKAHDVGDAFEPDECPELARLVLRAAVPRVSQSRSRRRRRLVGGGAQSRPDLAGHGRPNNVEPGARRHCA